MINSWSINKLVQFIYSNSVKNFMFKVSEQISNFGITQFCYLLENANCQSIKLHIPNKLNEENQLLFAQSIYN